MDSTWINAPAKINIGLDVLRRRDDGYHEVRMIMQSIRLFDRLTLTRTAEPGIHLTTNLSFLPVNKDNLVYRSASLLMEELTAAFPFIWKNVFRWRPAWPAEALTPPPVCWP